MIVHDRPVNMYAVVQLMEISSTQDLQSLIEKSLSRTRVALVRLRGLGLVAPFGTQQSGMMRIVGALAVCLVCRLCGHVHTETQIQTQTQTQTQTQIFN